VETIRISHFDLHRFRDVIYDKAILAGLASGQAE